MIISVNLSVIIHNTSCIKFTLGQAMTTRMVNRRYSSTISLTWALEVGVWLTPRPGHLTAGNHPVPIAWEDGWATGPAWMGAVNVTPIGFRSPGRPASNGSIHRLSYSGPKMSCNHTIIFRWNILYCHDEACGFSNRFRHTYARRSCNMTSQCWNLLYILADK
jgi:hypothetical protein